MELLVDFEDLDPNLGDNDGNTPLIYAAQAGEMDVKIMSFYVVLIVCGVFLCLVHVFCRFLCFINEMLLPEIFLFTELRFIDKFSYSCRAKIFSW